MEDVMETGAIRQLELVRRMADAFQDLERPA
jgi:hypothetical protein